jgi:hypothetical protein
MCHVFERFLMHCFEISRWLFRWFFFENSTGNRRAKVLNLLIFGSGDCGEVCRWMRCRELQLLLGYYLPFGECKLIVGLLSCSITPSYHQNVVSPITHACRDCQLVFFLAVSRTMPWYVWQRHCIGCKKELWRHPTRLVPPAPCS